MTFLIAAGLTALIVGVGLGLLALKAAGPPRRAPLLALASALPLHAASFCLVRLPLHAGLSRILPADALFWVGSFYAPMLEEPAKWLVFLIPAVRRSLTPTNATGVAMATGLGFGLGEIVTLAVLTMLRTPEQTHLPVWAYTGFLVERLFVCFLHGATIWLFVRRLAQGRSPWAAAAFGLALHYAINFPLVLATLQPFGVPRAVWLQTAMPWLVLLTFAMAAWMAASLSPERRRATLGVSRCRHCGFERPRSLLALNLAFWRLERCPRCGRWQVT